MTDRQTLTIDGKEWVAQKYSDPEYDTDRYRLFLPHWGDDAPTTLPAEMGRCSFCLDPSVSISEENRAHLVCDDCDNVETIVCSRATTVGEVRNQPQVPE